MSTRNQLREKLITRHANRKGLKGRITAMCISCIYDPYASGAGTWRKQIQDCTSKECPLFDVRPTSRYIEEDELEEEECDA